MTSYRTAPIPSRTTPPGIPYIVVNEAAERFSFFGLQTILIVFMTSYLLGDSGDLAVMSREEATGWFHVFVGAVYLVPLLGAILSDGLLGKYRTILWMSAVYCLGHLALALDSTRLGLALGLGLIALGSGGIKPCVAAHVGDQFGQSNAHLLPGVFGWFYMSISVGGFASALATPWLLEQHGPHVAFGVPGVVMLFATVVFWLGRNTFVHIPPGGKALLKETFSRKGLGSIAKLLVLYAFISLFWSLFAQTGSTWIIQAQGMDRTVFGWTILPSQMLAIHPVLLVVLTPIVSYAVYPMLDRVWHLTPLRKIGIGLFIVIPAFLLTAWIEMRIGQGDRPSILWQLLGYVFLTVGEIFAVITLLEFSYTQAPKKMKSLVMAAVMLSVSLGNVFTSAVNFIILNDDGSSKLSGPSYFLFFAAMMTVSAILFIPLARWYKETTYLQDEAEVASR